MKASKHFPSTPLTATEKRTIMALASVMSLRMLGLFMILPVFSLYAQHLSGVTPTLVGLAIGMYGLTQAILQIPFGFLSDRYGRKPLIYIGLILFALGSVLAAMSTSIWGVIIGRALQGGGAIAAVILALAADLTREEHRTKTMAMIGMSIGLAFMLALVLGPLLNAWIGVNGIFWVIALLALAALAIIHWVVPEPVGVCVRRDAETVLGQFQRVLTDPQLLRLDIGILLLHLSLTATFVVLPLSLKNLLAPQLHWQVYLGVIIASVITMMPFMMIAERYRQIKPVFVGAIALMALSQALFSYTHQHLTSLIFMLYLFFTAFILLEAMLPSLISKVAPADSKGTAMGIYTSAQFFGAFVGGVAGGWLHEHYEISTVFNVCALLTLLWLIVASSMRKPRYLTSQLLNIGQLDKKRAEELTEKLLTVTGVTEVVIILEEGVAYLKVDESQLDIAALDAFSVEHG